MIGNRQVTELLLLGCNIYALAMFVLGVRNSAGVNNLVIDQISTVAYSINGQRANSNEFLLDGAPQYRCLAEPVCDKCQSGHGVGIQGGDQ